MSNPIFHDFAMLDLGKTMQASTYIADLEERINTKDTIIERLQKEKKELAELSAKNSMAVSGYKMNIEGLQESVIELEEENESLRARLYFPLSADKKLKVELQEAKKRNKELKVKLLEAEAELKMEQELVRLSKLDTWQLREELKYVSDLVNQYHEEKNQLKADIKAKDIKISNLNNTTRHFRCEIDNQKRKAIINSYCEENERLKKELEQSKNTANSFADKLVKKVDECDSKQAKILRIQETLRASYRANDNLRDEISEHKVANLKVLVRLDNLISVIEYQKRQSKIDGWENEMYSW